MKPKTEKTNNFGLDVIQKEIKRLQDRATTLQSRAIVRTDANVEKTGAVVDIIRISTQTTERIMIEELRPVMNETRNLVQEILWKVDVYAKATRSDIGTFGFVRHDSKESYVFPKGIYVFFGRHISFLVSKEVIHATGIHLSRRLSSISPEQWEGINCHLYVATGWSSNEGFMLGRERHANDKCLQNLAMDPSTTVLIMLLYWSPQGKVPIKHDLTTNTDVSI